MEESYMNKQLSFCDFYSDFNKLVSRPPQLLQLLDEYISISDLIPFSWSSHYYKQTGRPHNNSLFSIVSCLLLQKLLSIPTVELLIVFLNFSSELRDFCKLKNVPDASFFSRFKQDYADDIEEFFHRLVDITEPVCQELGQLFEKEFGINPAHLYIMDTTGIECYVKENNPKFFNSLVKKLQYVYKDKSKEDIYKIAYSQMPKHAEADENIKLQYINGHFCYAHKAVVMSNALGIIRHLDFCDNIEAAFDTSDSSPEDSPEAIKVRWDGKLLKPSMDSFFKHHPSFSIKALAADSGFDDPHNYKYLFKEHNILPIIDLNPRNSNNSLPKPGINEDGIPTCPNDPSLPMKWDGCSGGKNRSFRIKFICPKACRHNGKLVTSCENPCTQSLCGRIFYTYPKDNYRIHTPIPRNSKQWEKYSKFRYIIEQVISSLKLPFQLGSLKQRNLKSNKADLFLAGAAQLITVILAYRMNSFDKIRCSAKTLAA